MLKKQFLYIQILTLLFFMVIPGNANSSQELIDKANQAYTQGEYADAVELYEQVLEEGYEAAELYYNLGNAYFKDDYIAKAILNYERAKKLKPNDDNVIHNLQVARSRIVDRIEPVPKLFYERWWQNITTMQSEKGWAVTAIVSVFGFFITLVLFFYASRKNLRKVFFIISIVFLVGTFFSLIFAQKQYNSLVQQDEAIVFAPRLTAKSAPDISSTNLFVIHRGTKVEILQTLGEWYEIRLPNGNVGWIKEDEVKII